LKIRTQRATKRSFVALVVTTLFASLLAFSGPAGAQSPVSPTTNRIHGADRYATSVALARNMLGAGNPTDGIIFASGESSADALSAAVLATANRPILLVGKDTISESVLDFITDYKASMAGASPTVFIIGGTEAISAANMTALQTAITVAGDVTPPTYSRLSGADRYATAAAIAAVAGIMVAADNLILVSGESWADGVSAGQLSAENGWPIVPMTKTGINASSKGTIDAYLALISSVKKFIIVGGEAALEATSVEDYLINTKAVPVANIRRIAGTDRYDTSRKLNLYMKADGVTGHAGTVVALVSGESPWDALAASSWSAVKNAHIQLTDKAGTGASQAALATSLAAGAHAAAAAGSALGETLNIIGGKSAVADSARTAFQASATAGNLTSTMSCAEGSKVLTLVLSGGLGTNEATAFATDGQGAEIKLTLNAAAVALGAQDVVKVSSSVYIYVLSTAAAQTNVFKFGGVTEDVAFGAGSHIFERSIGASSCTVANDAVKPVVTVQAVAGAHAATNDASRLAGPQWIITASEPIAIPDLDAADDWTCDSEGNNHAMTLTAITSATTGGATKYVGVLANAETGLVDVKIQAGDICTFKATAFTDLAGNNTAAAVSATLAADATAPTASISSATCVDQAQNALVRGNLTMTAVATASLGNAGGARGNPYGLTVTSTRGMLQPIVTVDDTAKTITVNADVGYHTAQDVTAAMTSVGGYSWVASGTGALTATVTAIRGITGKSTCTIKVDTNEPTALADTGYEISVAGLRAGYISNEGVTGTAAWATATTNANLRMQHVIAFRTATMGTGVMAQVAGANDLTDMDNNSSVTPVTFTIN
jgi:putative cell wall-binding protein